jgi:hypothetical protein
MLVAVVAQEQLEEQAVLEVVVMLEQLAQMVLMELLI